VSIQKVYFDLYLGNIPFEPKVCRLNAEDNYSDITPCESRIRIRMLGFAVNLLNFASCGRTYPSNWRTLRDQLGHTPQILYCGSQGKFVGRSTQTAQSQATDPEDALEMGEQHFNLLTFAT
jgi:hypothetical protein